MKEKMIVLGAGGHAKVVLDALEQSGQDILGLTDVAYREGKTCLGYPVLGTDACLEEYYKQGIKQAAIGIGHIGKAEIRYQVYQNVKKLGFRFPDVVHPKAVLSAKADLGEGIFFAAGCTVNAEAQIGNLCIINTLAVVEHEVTVGDNVHIAPGAVVLGAAKIGRNTFVGAGSVILQGVHVGDNCIVGAGSVVLKDVEANSVVVGNPARLIRNCQKII